jgi:hypothetical protein
MTVSPNLNIIKNQSVPTLTTIIEHCDFLIDSVLVQSDDLHWQLKSIRCIKCIVEELRKNMLEQHCSQKYINEKCRTLMQLATNFTVRDDVDIYEQSKSER